MSASFGGTTFDVEMPDYGEDAAANVNVRHIPGGDEVYVDYLGKTPRYLKPRIVATAANYATLVGKRGTSASLVMEDGTFTAVLMRISRGSRYDDDTTRGDAEFLVIS